MPSSYTLGEGLALMQENLQKGGGIHKGGGVIRKKSFRLRKKAKGGKGEKALKREKSIKIPRASVVASKPGKLERIRGHPK